MKKFLFSVILVLSLSSWAFAETIETESKVTEAIVYTNAAQVDRRAQVDVQEGLNEVIFTNVPENLNEATLTVSAGGTARAKILDAKTKTIFLERPESARIRELEDEIRGLEDEVVAFENQQTVLQEEREFLRSIKLYAGQQIPEDLVTKMPKTEELDSLNSFLKKKWQDSYVRELEIKRDLRKLNEKLEKLRKELNQLQQARCKEKRVISIELDVEQKGELTVVASYLMYQASWYPEYDARVDYENQKVELVCLGIVKQTSGEDWQNVQLTLSTAKPTISGRMPELGSWILRPYQTPPMSRRTGVPVFDLEMMKKQEGIDAKSAWAVLPEPEEASAGRMYAQAEEKLTSVNYKIARAVDIKSDGTKHRLPVFSEDFSVNFRYATTPKLTPFAYLVSKVTNEREQLLPASVRIFLDEVYVGSSTIDAIGKGEEFDLYLGIDEGVKVKREKLKEEIQEIWIAGIKRKNKVVQTTYKITIENYKSKDIKVDLFDHFPVSQTDQIAVKIQEVMPKPTEEDYEDTKGLMRWELDIKPRQKQEVSYTYQVEHPRDMNIGL